MCSAAPLDYLQRIPQFPPRADRTARDNLTSRSSSQPTLKGLTATRRSFPLSSAPAGKNNGYGRRGRIKRVYLWDRNRSTDIAYRADKSDVGYKFREIHSGETVYRPDEKKSFRVRVFAIQNRLREKILRKVIYLRTYVQNGMKGSIQSFSIRLRLRAGTCTFCRPRPWATVEHILPRGIERRR
ncbi:hypothetical protein PUN28_015115 [Cardiocondyla obscurior]|uniref:Uncharacterized protein n=1 Tax=Cardiocondyla obscurior TaxID=286306 RepID=A0AAW2EX73_9HYME